jgi:hypothetical protein
LKLKKKFKNVKQLKRLKPNLIRKPERSPPLKEAKRKIKVTNPIWFSSPLKTAWTSASVCPSTPSGLLLNSSSARTEPWSIVNPKRRFGNVSILRKMELPSFPPLVNTGSKYVLWVKNV